MARMPVFITTSLHHRRAKAIAVKGNHLSFLRRNCMALVNWLIDMLEGFIPLIKLGMEG
jgi:hypothetical protein